MGASIDADRDLDHHLGDRVYRVGCLCGTKRLIRRPQASRHPDRHMLQASTLLSEIPANEESVIKNAFNYWVEVWSFVDH